MLSKPADVLTYFPVRKSKKQKEAFQSAIKNYSEKLDYVCTIETGSFGARNIVIGNPEKAKFLVSAHYDTCARMFLPNFITPCNLWIYSGYQVLLIGIIVILSALAGGVLGAITANPELGTIAALVIYWILLMLMILGPANLSNANDNTSGVITLLEILKTMPENQRDKVCFVLFDLEEAGLIGSSSYRKKHRQATEHQMVLNLDCVGDGDHLRLFPTKKLLKDRKKLTSLYKACGYFGKKDVLVQEKGKFFYPSDQMNFPYGVGIAALCNSKCFGLYYSKIHTPKDTSLDETNINILRAAISSYITCDAAQ